MIETNCRLTENISYTDKMTDLAKKAKAGDEAAFTSLVLECEDTLYGVSYGILANEEDCADAVQEAVFKAYQEIGKLRKLKYFKTWLVRILINECNKIIKSSINVVPAGKLPNIVSSGINGQVEIVNEALAALKEPLKLTMILYYIEGFSTNEVAKIMKIPQGTVKSRLSKGRKILADIISKEDLV